MLRAARRRRSCRANGSTRSAAGRSSSSPTTSGRSRARSSIRSSRTTPSSCRRRTTRGVSQQPRRCSCSAIRRRDRRTPKRSIVRDAAGQADGPDARGGVPPAGRRNCRRRHGAELEASTRAMIKDLNRAGPHRVWQRRLRSGRAADVSGSWPSQDQLNVRVVLHRRRRRGAPSNVDRALPRIAQMKLFQGDDYVDKIFYGESVYGPLHDPMFIPKSDPKPEQLAQWRRIATEIAKARLPLHVHANLTNTIDAFPRSDRGDQQGVPDQEPALGAGARQPAQRVAARAHEAAGDVRGRASLGRHQRRHQSTTCSATPRTTWRR